MKKTKESVDRTPSTWSISTYLFRTMNNEATYKNKKTLSIPRL